ncbi:MAG TPA: DUF4375 domain-containing protein [Thermoplasmata archaeon]
MENETDQDAIVDIYNLLSSDFSGNPEKLSVPERNICYIEELDNEVNMAGFRQFFLNPSGAHAQEIVSALNEIKSVSLLRITERAVGQFPNALVPKDPNTRRTVVNQIEGVSNPVWESLDNEFSQYEEDIYALMTEYARNNIGEFR